MGDWGKDRVLHPWMDLAPPTVHETWDEAFFFFAFLYFSFAGSVGAVKDSAVEAGRVFSSSHMGKWNSQPTGGG